MQQPGSGNSAPPSVDANHLTAEPYSAAAPVFVDATVPSDATALLRLSRSSWEARPAATAEQQDSPTAAGATVAAKSARQMGSGREGVAAADVDSQSEGSEQQAAADNGISSADVGARFGGSQSADGNQNDEDTASTAEDSFQLQAGAAPGASDYAGPSTATDADANLSHDEVAATSAQAYSADSDDVDCGSDTSGMSRVQKRLATLQAIGACVQNMHSGTCVQTCIS